MPLMGCSTNDLMTNSKCYQCLSDTDILKAQIYYRELIYSKRANLPVRTGAQVLAASVAWRTLSDHARMAIEATQLANDAVLLSAIASPSAEGVLRNTACYCGAGLGDLRAANDYLKCLIRNES